MAIILHPVICGTFLGIVVTYILKGRVFDRGNMEVSATWKKIEELSNRFFHSDLFILIMAFLSVSGWVISVWADGAWVYFLFIMIIMTIFMLCTCPDSTPIFALMFFMLPTANIKAQEQFSNYAWLIYPCIVLVLSIVFNLIRFKPNFKEVLEPGKMRKTTFSMFLILIPMILGGLFKWWRNWTWMLIYAALFIVLSFAFIYFLAVGKDKIKDRRKLIKTLMKMMVAAGLVVSIQIIVFYINLGSFQALMTCISDKGLNLGWGSPNPVAATLILYMPANFYFIISKNKYTFLFILKAALEFMLMVSASSRGALLFSTIGMVILSVYVFIKSENKLQMTFTFGAVFGVAIGIFVGFYQTFFHTIIERLSSFGMDDNGRFDIYLYGLNVFLRHPVFGSGWDFGIGLQHVNFSPYLFHSTIIQIAACSGIVGLLCYAYYYYARYRTFFIEKSPYCYVLLACMWIFEGYAMIDPILFFPPTFFIQLLIMSFVMEMQVDDSYCRAFKENGRVMKGIRKQSKSEFL